MLDIKHVILLFSCNIAVTVSCCEPQVTFESVPHQTVCSIPDSIGIDFPYCMEVLDETHFALSTFDKVLLFTTDGTCMGTIGNSGRAAGEYSFPLKVRRGAPGELFVWSANTMRFLRYTLEGRFINAYPYESALSDFMVKDNLLYIYTAGNRGDCIIDIYDINDNSIIGKDDKCSEYHKLLTTTISSSPICLIDGLVYYSPKDKLEIRNLVNGNTERRLNSSSFHLNRRIKPDVIRSDRTEKQKFMSTTSYICGLLPHNDEFFVLSYEGTSTIIDNHLDNGQSCARAA